MNPLAVLRREDLPEEEDERFSEALEEHQRLPWHVAPFGECLWSGCREWAIEPVETDVAA